MRRFSLPLLVATAMASCVAGDDGESEVESEDVDDIEAAILAAGATADAAFAEPLDPTSPHGAIPATFQVDGSGSATYSIPIEVPPGLGGVEPKLALAYNSRAGNGIAGMGFNLSGLPLITRCARTVAQDNVRGGVNGDANDRFCLDGQRLVAISGTYGAHDTEYRTELESWTRIVSKGNCNIESCYFEVTAKDGTRTQLGGSSDSRTVLPNGLVRSWGVNKVTSTSGNYMTVQYIVQGADGEMHPWLITYTYRADGQPTRLRWVYFDYGNRTDVETSYLRGSRWRSTQRLQNIYTQIENPSGTSVVSRYELNYAYSARTSRSLLTSVKRCEPYGQCLQPTTFTWPDPGTEDFTPVFPVGGIYQDELQAEVGVFLHPGDFDGDGRTDFIRQEHSDWDNEDSSTFTVYESNATASFTRKYPLTDDYLYQHDLRFDDGANIVTGDFDGDGRTDFLRQPRWGGAGPFRIHYSLVPVSTGADADASKVQFQMFEPAGDSQVALPQEGARIIPGDYNGDGKTDFIRQEQGPWNDDYAHTFQVYFATDTKGAFNIVEPPGNQYQMDLAYKFGARILPGDYNGDGMTDFIRQEHGSWDNDDSRTFSVYFSRGDGTFDVVFPPGYEYQTLLRFDPGALIHPADFNGDGKTDFLRQEQGGWDNDSSSTIMVYLSRGDGYFDVQYQDVPELQALLRHERAFLHFLDFNGDGRTDILSQEHGDWGGDQVDTASLYLSLGNGQFRRRPLTGYVYDELLRFDPGCQIQTADVNGDGNEDLLRQERGYWDDNNISTFAVYFANGPKGTDLLKSVRDGYGGTTNIDYAPLTDPSVHAIHPGGAPPAAGAPVPMRAPMYVVKKVAQRDRGEAANRDTFEHAYFYKDGRVDPKGRGFLGFAAVVDTDVGTGAVTTTTYHQAFPLTGRVFERTTVFKDNTSDASDNPRVITTYEYLQPTVVPGAAAPLHVAPTMEQIYRKEGGKEYWTKTEYQYSAYGNLGLVRHKGLLGSGGDDHDTCTSYTNDAAAWRLGYPFIRIEANACQLLSDGSCNCGPDTELLSQEVRDYDARGLVGNVARWRTQDSTWEWSAFGYDALGRVNHRMNAAKVHEWIAYDPTDAAFVSRIDTCQHGGGLCTSRYFAHDPRFGEQVMEVDENGNVSTRVLDGLGRVTRTREEDPAGNLVDVTKHVQGGDSLGRPYRETRRRTGWEADAAWTSEIEYLDGFGRTTQRVRTQADNPSAPKILQDVDFDPKSGLVISESAPYLSTAAESDKTSTTRTYDSQGRPISVTDPAGSIVTTAYAVLSYPWNAAAPPDPNCPTCVLEVQVTDAVNQKWKRYVDVAGRTVKQIDPAGRASSFAYDRLGRKVSVAEIVAPSDPAAPLGSANITTTFEYDSLGRVLSTTSTDRGTFGSKYDARGLLQQTKDARGKVVTFQYDGLARLTRKAIGNEECVVYDYDEPTHTYGKGRLTMASVHSGACPPPEAALNNPSSRYKFHYSAQGQATKVEAFIEGADYEVTTTFDPLGRARKIAHHDGTVVTRTYDVLGNLTAAKLVSVAVPATSTTPAIPSQTVGADYSSFTAAGQPLSIKHLNAVDTKYTYKASGQLESLATTKGTKLLQQHQYQWDSAHRPTSVSDTHPVTTNGVSSDVTTNQTFTYTSSGQLATATGVYGTLSYAYDTKGNLTGKEGVTQAYEGHRLTETKTPVPATADAPASIATTLYQHDAAGNRTLRRPANERVEYVYSAENRLTEVKRQPVLSGGTLGSPQQLGAFTYSFTGERASKTDANGVKTLYFGPDVEVTVLSQTNRLVTRYVTGPAGRIASHTMTYKPMTPSSSVPVLDQLREVHPRGPRSFQDLLAMGASLVSLWSRQPAAWWQGALGLALLALSVAALRRPAVVGRALRTAVAFHDRAWASRFDTRFVRMHRLQALVVPFVLASFLAGCQPTRLSLGDQEETGSSEDALTAGDNGAGHPVAGIRYFHHDHIGSSSLVTGADGVETARVVYKPFGEIVDSASPGTDEFRAKFTGKEWDKDIGLYYYSARYYDPQTGRFTTADSLLHGGPEHLTVSLDPYAYAGNNPVTFTDPSGHDFGLSLIIAIAIGVAVGAYMGGAAANGTYDASRWKNDWRTWTGIAVGGVAGGAGGGIGAAGLGVAGGVLAGVITSAATEGLRFLSPQGNTVGGFFMGVGIGAAAGGVGAGAGMAVGRRSFTQTFRSGRWQTLRGAREGYRVALKEGAETGQALVSGAYGAQAIFRDSNIQERFRELGERFESGGDSPAGGSPYRFGNTPPPSLGGTTPARGQHGEGGDGFQQPLEVRTGAASVERFGAALVRDNMGLGPLIDPGVSIAGHDSSTLAAAASAR